MSGRLGELIVILLIVFIFFGAGKLPKVMKELSKGLKSIKKDDSETSNSPQQEESPEETRKN